MDSNTHDKFKAVLLYLACTDPPTEASALAKELLLRISEGTSIIDALLARAKAGEIGAIQDLAGMMFGGD